MLHIADADIGGGYVRRTFTNSGRQMKRGDELTRNDVLAIPLANRKALIEGVFIEVYPLSPGGGEKFLVGVGNNEYNVIQGRVINTAPLPRKEAEKLLHA